MQTYFTFTAATPRPRPEAPPLPRAPQSAPVPRPEPAGLTRAQLREMVIEQIG